MSNGSRRSSDELRLGQARCRSQGLRLWLACVLAILSGCHQATLRRRPDLVALGCAVRLNVRRLGYEK